MGYRALTKIQVVILVAIFVIASVSASLAYIFLNDQNQAEESIKIGILADLDMPAGKQAWHAAQLAAEQLNNEGGLLGRQVEVIGEDHDLQDAVSDLVKVSAAMLRLISYHKVDFILAQANGEAGFVCQDLAAEHKKIILMFGNTEDEYAERVQEDYEKYKYFFRGCSFNATSVFLGMTDSMLLLRNLTGFNKIGYIGEDISFANEVLKGLEYVLSEIHGFDFVYKGKIPLGTFDFTSYFVNAESAGTEILIPLIVTTAGLSFIREHYDRQSPTLVAGGVLTGGGEPESWALTEGKCDNMIVGSFPSATGYPLTSQTLPFHEAYLEKWSESPKWTAAYVYDSLRFILADAIRRAGTIETEAVIEALEQTSIETSNARNFVFTPNHDVMMGENPNDPEADYQLVMLFQWQGGKQLPVYPKKIMDEAGATLTFPDWLGPWG